MDTILERRKHRRHHLKQDGALVDLHKHHLLRFGKYKTFELGPLVDISMGGIGVLYVGKQLRPANSNLLSIRMSKDNSTIDKLSFQVVSDCATIFLPGSAAVRKCGIKFDKLTNHQNLSLQNFIQNHTK
jgi:hypothetical protein